jgi:hypothetical protein
MGTDAESFAAARAGFDWDAGNLLKNWRAHGVLPSECEEVFFNRPVLLAGDRKHSGVEARYALLGRANARRLLTIVFTLRHGEVRVISARAMSRKERTLYDTATDASQAP